jgi:thiol:disulfide interchange protein DsbC
MMAKSFLLLLSLGLTLPGAYAADDVGRIKAALQRLVPHGEPDSITPSPIPGLYQVVYGTTLVYVTGDGRYLLQGDLVDLQQRKNLTEHARAATRLAALRDLDQRNLIVFAPEHPKHTVTVFTDVDCTYCRKFHSEIAEYNKLGIAVRYAAFPRSGIGSPSYEKAVSVWCATDRKAAITEAKAGKEVEQRTCDNPVKDEFLLGQRLGVSGTPTIILEDGTELPGYVPPLRLSQLLDRAEAQPHP